MYQSLKIKLHQADSKIAHVIHYFSLVSACREQGWQANLQESARLSNGRPTPLARWQPMLQDLICGKLNLSLDNYVKSHQHRLPKFVSSLKSQNKITERLNMGGQIVRTQSMAN